jgi:hypothetical protein
MVGMGKKKKDLRFWLELEKKNKNVEMISLLSDKNIKIVEINKTQ